MREPVRDRGRLEHILAAINYVEAFSQGLSFDALTHDALHLHAVVHNVQVIGEAVYKLSSEFKSAHPQTPWAIIEKMRHVLVHDYYQIDLEILWDIIKNDLPSLKSQVQEYLQ
ncbi:MAG: DUF86 domain-containing protein [Bacteroidales bacterium]|nr:DUF86 domain-containing protein [Bacteroidales bacterium]